MGVFYHSSYDCLPVGAILVPRANYENDWKHTDFYWPLERYRPKGKIAHKNAVFMCENPEDCDLAGGPTEWLFTVEPLGPIQRHDQNWSSEISMLVGERPQDEAKV